MKEKTIERTGFVAGLIWLPITIWLMYFTGSWISFALLMAGIMGWGYGEEKTSTSSNYRLGGWEYHTYESPPSPFHIGFSYMGGGLIIGWLIYILVQWVL